MALAWADWLVIIAYFALTLAIAFLYRRRASRGLDEFFVSGRKMPWWLAGTSMVATTFAADTPLAVTGMVAAHGIAGNWLWWSFAFSGLLTAFLFARLWRRSGVLTDVELAELRYAGKPAAFLRGFRAVYLGVFINCIVLGWVNLALVKVLELTLGVEKTEALMITLGLTALTCFTSALSGLRGVLVADLVQFVLMMAMSAALAVFSVKAVGGLGALTERVSALPGDALAFFPSADSAWMPLTTFCVYLGVVWWSTWYPGSEPGGGGFIAQRMFSTADERQSLLSTLWFNVAHYALRPWPWILCALAALALYPDLEDPETGYVRLLVDHLPDSLRGLTLAGFVAAFMSTVSTNLNWGAGYLVSDVYKRFCRPVAPEDELIRASRWATALLAVAASVVTFYMDSIAGAWKLLLATGAGTGGVLILRWFWWRVNAWSEITAMAAAAAVSLALQLGAGLDSDDPLDFSRLMLTTVGITTTAWVAVALSTRPEPPETLEKFYRLVRPAPGGWGPVAAAAPDVKPTTTLAGDLALWASSSLMVYAALFGSGKILLGSPGEGAAWLAAAAASGAFVGIRLRNDARSQEETAP